MFEITEIKKPESIDLKGSIPEIKSSFKRFQEDVTEYFILSGISKMLKTIQVFQCLSLIGVNAMNLYNFMKSNGDFDDNEEYLDILTKMESRFIKDHAFLSRNLKFFCRMQGVNETLDDYLTGLYELRPTDTDTKKDQDEIMMSQLIKGLYNTTTKQKLRMMENLNLERTIQICRAVEQEENEILGHDSFTENWDLVCNLSLGMQTMSIDEYKIDEGEATKENGKGSDAAENVEETDNEDEAIYNSAEEDGTYNITDEDIGEYNVTEEDYAIFLSPGGNTVENNNARRNDAVPDDAEEDEGGYYDFHDDFEENDSNDEGIEEVDPLKTIDPPKHKNTDNNLGSDVPNYNVDVDNHGYNDFHNYCVRNDSVDKNKEVNPLKTIVFSKRRKIDNLRSDTALYNDSDEENKEYYDFRDHSTDNNNHGEDKDEVNLFETIVSHKRKKTVDSSDDDYGNQNDKDYCTMKITPYKKKALNVKYRYKKNDEDRKGTAETGDAKQEGNSDLAAAVSPEHDSFMESDILA